MMKITDFYSKERYEGMILTFKKYNECTRRKRLLECLGDEPMLYYIKYHSHVDVFEPTILIDKATGKHLSEEEAKNYQGEVERIDDERPEAEWKTESGRKIGLTNAMVESGIGSADMGDYTYHTYYLKDLTIKNDEDLLIEVFKLDRGYAELYFTYSAKPADMSADIAWNLARLCYNSNGEKDISPLLKEYVKAKTNIQITTEDYISDDSWREILEYVENKDIELLKLTIEEIQGEMRTTEYTKERKEEIYNALMEDARENAETCENYFYTEVKGFTKEECLQKEIAHYAGETAQEIAEWFVQTEGIGEFLEENEALTEDMITTYIYEFCKHFFQDVYTVEDNVKASMFACLKEKYGIA